MDGLRHRPRLDHAPGTTAGHDQDVIASSTSDPPTLFPAVKYSSCPPAMMGLSYDWTSMKSLVNNMVANGSTNQPIGLAMGWLSLAGGGPLTAPAKDSNYNYNEIIILLSGRLEHPGPLVRQRLQHHQHRRRPHVRRSGDGTCANIKEAGVTLYTIQVNTSGDPTSTLLQNCAG